MTGAGRGFCAGADISGARARWPSPRPVPAPPPAAAPGSSARSSTAGSPPSPRSTGRRSALA
ncbi:hypothetical protein [Phenylobacterium sp. J367]|uniref:hypothetical protein n=1 Tax=Phenylobacterium sp. J367 TaxID=2898435 RepID=UPI0027E28923|nr:hypothetical protein [Phenylobacterium sp. J367]